MHAVLKMFKHVDTANNVNTFSWNSASFVKILHMHHHNICESDVREVTPLFFFKSTIASKPLREDSMITFIVVR